ncbi:PREDICTED: uncharacterized protein LOC108356729 [Rhagoletis zephyria]|uniref:uncharacterized protein LOC108356729 n=1 Tax=Rhagoletis zephyria TaxID=28612 RepID=UPI00081196BD|nr:PREDICTED: uncharacterized protein LOC108356729 [Rhagoletis zephyria]
MRRSPRKCDIKSPVSNLNKSPPTATTCLDTLHIQHEKMSIASTPSSPTNQAVENGRIPTAVANTPTLRTMSETFVDSEVETIDKISAMIASTTNESTPVADANSNSSIKSVGERESSILSSGVVPSQLLPLLLNIRSALVQHQNIVKVYSIMLSDS